MDDNARYFLISPISPPALSAQASIAHGHQVLCYCRSRRVHRYCRHYCICMYARSLCPIPMDSPFYGLFPPSADSLHSGYTNTRIYSRTCLLLPSATICRIWCMEYQSRPQCWDIVTVIYCRPAGSNGPSVVQPLVGTSSHRKEITSIPIFRHRNACLPATS